MKKMLMYEKICLNVEMSKTILFEVSQQLYHIVASRCDAIIAYKFEWVRIQPTIYLQLLDLMDSIS